jgi:recombination protein RecR
VPTKIDYPAELRHLIAQFKRLPGIGPRSAERIVLWLLRQKSAPSGELANALHEVAQHITLCDDCGFFSSAVTGCAVCHEAARDATLLCVVEQSTDILPLERTGAYHGHYHALHGRISPLDNVGPDALRIGPLLRRVAQGSIREVILATGSDVEGEATAHYLSDALRRTQPTLVISRLAQGLPAGGGLESADELTLHRALSGRRHL